MKNFIRKCVITLLGIFFSVVYGQDGDTVTLGKFKNYKIQLTSFLNRINTITILSLTLMSIYLISITSFKYPIENYSRNLICLGYCCYRKKVKFKVDNKKILKTFLFMSFMYLYALSCNDSIGYFLYTLKKRENIKNFQNSQILKISMVL